jgi:hypothetical protein
VIAGEQELDVRQAVFWRAGQWQRSPNPSRALSSGCASKAVELTSGELPLILDSRMRGEKSLLIRWQESAEGEAQSRKSH